MIFPSIPSGQSPRYAVIFDLLPDVISDQNSLAPCKTGSCIDKDEDSSLHEDNCIMNYNTNQLTDDNMEVNVWDMDDCIVDYDRSQIRPQNRESFTWGFDDCIASHGQTHEECCPPESKRFFVYGSRDEKTDRWEYDECIVSYGDTASEEVDCYIEYLKQIVTLDHSVQKQSLAIQKENLDADREDLMTMYKAGDLTLREFAQGLFDLQHEEDAMKEEEVTLRIKMVEFEDDQKWANC